MKIKKSYQKIQKLFDKYKTTFKKRRIAASRLISLFIALIIAFSIGLISLFKLTETYELRSLDLRFGFKPRRAVAESIQIIEIEDKSIQEIGRWPWPRAYHASLLHILSLVKPRTVTYDIFFSEPDADHPEDDLLFAKKIQESGNVFLAFYFKLLKAGIPQKAKSTDYIAPTKTGLNYSVKPKDKFIEAQDIVLPIPELSQTCCGLFAVNVLPDSDGVTRRMPLVIKYKNSLFPTLPLAAACHFWGAELEDLVIKQGEFIIIPVAPEKLVRIPIDDKGQLLINYSANYHAFSRHSFIALVANYNQRQENLQARMYLEQFKDRILLIGLTATGTVDLRLTPLEDLSPGVGVQARALNSILLQDFIYRLPASLNILILILTALVLGSSIPRISPLKGLVLSLGVILLIILSAIFVFNFFNLWIDIINPLLVISLAYPLILINQFIAEQFKNRLLSQELAIARKIQQSFLPREIPKVNNYKFSAQSIPARQVGGDLYDFKLLEDKAISIAIGDVTGKGIPAALYMAKSISDFRSRAESDPAKTLGNINRTLCQEGTSGMFLTFLNLILFPQKNTLYISNAGHHPAFKVNRAGEKVEFIDAAQGLPLGIMADVLFSNAKFIINKGDTLILFTDGVEEAVNRKGEQFGKERLKQIALENKTLTPENLIQVILAKLNAFTYHMPQHDDITLVVIQRTA